MKSCPNKNDPKWKALVNELGEFKAFEAYSKNGEVIPDVESDVVKKIKTIDLDFGAKDLKLQIDPVTGEESDYYYNNTSKFHRITAKIGGLISYFSKINYGNKTLWEYNADKEWGNGKVDKNTKLRNKRTQELETYEEFKKSEEKFYKRGMVKGKVIHKIVQAYFEPSKKDQLVNEALELINNHNNTMQDTIKYSEYSWLTKDADLHVLKRIFRKVNINVLEDIPKLNGYLRDIVNSEVTVSNDLLKFAGTIDILVKHSTGLFSIVDLKTGNRQDSEIERLTNTLFKYGNQIFDIPDTFRNRAKLQVALYAVMLKANNPNIKFEDLFVAWIPNEYNALKMDKNMEVEVEAYIPMIEQLLKDKSVLKEMGLNSNTYMKLIKKSPDLFNPSHYSSKISSDLAEKIAKSDKTPQQILDEKYAELQSLNQGDKEFFSDKNIPKDAESRKIYLAQRERAKELVEEIQEMTKGDSQLLKNGEDDVNFLTRWFGNHSDIRNAMVNLWSNAYKRAKRVANMLFNDKTRKLTALVKEVRDEYTKSKGIVVIGDKFQNLNYEEMYGDMIIYEDVEGLAYKRPRLVTKNDKEIYNKLTKNQRNLVDFINSTMKDYFDNYLSESSGKRGFKGAELSHAQAQGLEYYEGLFPKIPITPEELRFRAGKGSNIVGAFKMIDLKEKFRRATTYFVEDTFELQNSDIILPIKYMGNEYIESSDNFSKNLELAMANFIENMEWKKQMQPIYAYGKTLQYYLEQQFNDKNGDPLYAGAAEWLRLRIIKDVLGETLKTKYSTKKVRIPIINKEMVIHPDKLVQLLMNWTRMTTMILKPIAGLGNGIHAKLLVHRKAVIGSISERFAGITNTDTDMTHNDMVFADKEYLNYVTSGIKGTMRQNKLWLLDRHLNYFGNDFKSDYIENVAISERNKGISPYVFHHTLEESVALTTLAAQLHHLKVKMTDGTEKSIWDCYEVVEKNGETKLEWTGGVRGYVKEGVDLKTAKGTTAIMRPLTELDHNEIEHLKKVHEVLQGGYRKDEGMNIEIYTLGRAFVQFKKYLPRLIINALQGKKKSIELGKYVSIGKDNEGKDIFEWRATVIEGKWITFANFLMSVARREYKWDNLNVQQKQNVIEGFITLFTLLAMYGAYAAMFHDEDDDDAAKKFWKMYLVDNLSQQYNPMDMLRTLSTASNPAFIARLYKQANATITLLAAEANYQTGNEDEALTKKGDLKGWNDFIKGIPYLASAHTLMDSFRRGKSIETDTWFSNESVRLK